VIHGERLISVKVLIINDELNAPSAAGRAIRELAKELREGENIVVEAKSADDVESVILSDSSVQGILLDWTLGDDDTQHDKARALLALIREGNAHVPIFLMAQRDDAVSLNAAVLRNVDELIWILEDTTFFIGGRILAAVRRYREALAPPMTRALIAFATRYEYSWHTPSHAGGTAFLKLPVGRVFYDYFGENLFRSDLSISVGELGSLLDHSGPIGESEKFCARVYGAHRSYTVTNGSSMSNRVIMMSSVTRGDYALCDRNAHKSTELHRDGSARFSG
jgi:arginine decarboxylase